MGTSSAKEDAELTLTGMGTQLGINVAIAVGVFLIFSLLRPNNSLVYAPKYKYASKTKQPPTLGHGIFSWFKPVMFAPDDILIDKIGYDATLFIQFIRLIRKMLYFMTFVGVCIIIPVNIIATSFTGEWPPTPGVEFLSISTINYYDGKFHAVNGNLLWYWCHAGSTWVYSIIIYICLWRFYKNYIQFRQNYFKSDEYQNSMHGRTLMIFNVPPSLRSDEALSRWVNKLNLKFPPQQVCIGTQNEELARYVREHEEAVRNLEITLSSYLKDGQVIENKKRPKIRLDGYGCCGGRKVDAIDYYSEKIQVLQQKITDERAKIEQSKKTNYGWILFDTVGMAHANAKYLASASSPVKALTSMFEGPTPSIHLAPQPKDILWSNLALNEHVRRSKRLVITCVFYAFVFLWFIPSSFLSASNNVKNILKLFPNSTQFIKNNPTFVSLFSAWFTPIVMAIFFFILPKVLRFLSQQQGYMTETSLDRQVLAKLFVFFIINNLLVFTVSSTLISIYTEIQQAVVSGQTLSAIDFYLLMKSNLTQVAKNFIDVSTYWVNYVCLKGLGVIVDLAQVIVLITVTLRKFFTRPSPRQLQEFTRPSVFDFPLFYNVLLFFFTVGLAYSVIAPLVLPFTLLYFLLSTMVFRYLLMYVFVTQVETGGQIWRLLFNRLLVSVLIFQLLMIAVLVLKSARIEAIAVSPLPLLTLLFKWVCRIRFDRHVYYYHHQTESHIVPEKPHGSINVRFGDPAFFSTLPIPMVHERVRHLLPKIYNATNQTIRKPFVSRMTRQKSVRHVSIIHPSAGGDLEFQSVADRDLELDDSEEGIKGLYKFNQDDENSNLVDPPNTSYYSDSFGHSQTGVLRRLSQRLSQSIGYPKPVDPYSARKPLVDSYLDSEDQRRPKEDMEYFVAGRAYRSHHPDDLKNRSNLIEMANIHRSPPRSDQPHYIRNPVQAVTTGFGKIKNHPTQPFHPDYQIPYR